MQMQTKQLILFILIAMFNVHPLPLPPFWFGPQKRKLYEQLLREVPILKSLNETELNNLADALLTREFKDGQTIIKQGY